MTDVTLNLSHLFKFYLLLARNHDSGKFVRSITLVHRAVMITREEQAEIRKNWPEIIDAIRAQGISFERSEGFEYAVEGVYRFLPNIQTLVIGEPAFNIPLRPAPLPFLSHSLKKLFIPMWSDGKIVLKARNVVWILVFCTGLRSATLCCIFDQNDFKYLAEFSDAFSGLSQIRKLALGVDFSVNESIQRYWDAAVGKQWIGGNKMSQAVFYLLKVTKDLQCLEINCSSSVQQEKHSINFSCLLALRGSCFSLESLRLFGLGINLADPEEYKANTKFSLFVRLRVIYMDALMLAILKGFRDLEFPPGLRVVRIPYYDPYSIHEDLELARVLKVRSFPNLEAVVVPSTSVIKTGAHADSEEFKKHWFEGRRELEKAEVFTSGKVKLRLVEPGETSEYCLGMF